MRVGGCLATVLGLVALLAWWCIVLSGLQGGW
jgi:hypothetical protein